MCADNAFYDRSLLDWRKAQKTKSIFRGNLRLSVKVGDLVTNKLTGNTALIIELWAFGRYAQLTNGEKAATSYLRMINESR
tara:strand:+ start:327 stop:569 length:243 start_codon:yes stop_codon:yes gene_type:complete